MIKPNGGISVKKFASLLLVIVLLATLLTACSRVTTTVDSNGENGSFAPENTSVPSSDITIDPTSEPTAEPAASELPEAVDVPLEVTPTPEPTMANTVTSTPEPTYSLSPLTDNSFGFLFSYPSGWENLPGKHTVCFRESVESGDVPARVAITKKSFAHEVSESRLLSQFKSFATSIYPMYNEEHFEFGDLNESAKFMGKDALEIPYYAYSGETEVVGYMICCSDDHDMYVFHFCAPYEDYKSMESMMKAMRDSVKLIG